MKTKLAISRADGACNSRPDVVNLDAPGGVVIDALSSGNTAQGDESTFPTLAHLEMIHRHPDGVVTFHRKQDDRFENLFGVRAQYLPQVFRDICADIESDAFMSINAYWHPSTNQRFLGPHTGYRDQWRI